MQQLLSECDPTIHSLSLCRLTFSRWSGCDGSAPGSSSVSWCHTQRASSGRLPQANHEPPRSRGPSGSTHKAQGPGCSFPQPHLHTAWRTEFCYLTSKKLYKSGSLCSKHGLLRHCFMKKSGLKKGLLTVEHSEDLLHHLPQNKDVGLGIWWSSRFPMFSILTQFAEIALLVFGMGICCSQILQAWHPWPQIKEKWL